MEDVFTKVSEVMNIVLQAVFYTFSFKHMVSQKLNGPTKMSLILANIEIFRQK